MTADEKMDTSEKKSFKVHPLWVVLAALVLYGVTLQHWVTLSSLPLVSKITGWDWHPGPLPWRPTPVYPLYLLLTLPVRILPASLAPIALNLFAAVCAALTLGLLAASVALLPHDRTREQRQREGGEFALLSVRGAFLPPLFAVLMLGFQLTFWHNAIVSTGEMLDLLVFAFLVFCLLKFRISQNDSWLSVFALAYGLGVTNNWALIGFFPLFLTAIIWIKGISFFNWRLLARMAGWGLLGLSLYLLVPAIGSLGRERANFVDLLHIELGAQAYGLRSVPRWLVAVAALPTLLPLFFAGIKWPSFEGELSAAGSSLTKLMFRVLHIVFLLLALVLFFDFRFSPSLSLAGAPVDFLTFYYVGALCIGYFSGYVLLVFGKSPSQSWDKRSLLDTILNPVVIVALCLLAIAAPCSTFVKNIAHINASRNAVLGRFANAMVEELPNKPLVVLSDDPVRLHLLDAAYARQGKANPNIMIETSSLPYRDYIGYLVTRYPDLQKITPPIEKLPHVLAPQGAIAYLINLSRKYSIYYLQPSFGYYFEVFYLKPHGLVYEMHMYGKDVIDPPVVTPQEVAENQAVWSKLEKTSFGNLAQLAKLDADNAAIADNYSVDLDQWAVELQKAGYLKEAHDTFAQSIAIHPQNFIARINLAYNEHLQKNDHRPLDSRDWMYKAMNYYRGYVPILKMNGPSDEPGLNQDFGTLMAQGKDYRQSVILFDRRLQLIPNDPLAELDLAKTYVDWGSPDKAFAMIKKLHANPSARSWDVVRVEALAYLGKRDFATAEKLLLGAYKENPQEENRAATMAEFYGATARASLQEAGNAARHTNMVVRDQYITDARRRYTNALAYIDIDAQLLTQASHNSSDPPGLPELLLQKAQIQMQLNSFSNAIKTLNRILELQPKSAVALLNRAAAETELNQMDAATEDYKELRKLVPQQRYVADYGLADIAHRQKNSTEEIRYLQRYLTSAPDDQAEYQAVKQRLRKLELH